MKNLYIAEKPSVAREFANALHENMRSSDGFLESENSVVTWCVGHLVTMSYPEAYDENLRRWRYDTLPFLPEEFRYEIIPSSKKQFEIVKRQLNRSDVGVIYICTDSGREGEYIYRLVDRMAGVSGKERRRVWIDSQTEEEILRGIREAKDWSAYDSLSDAAYLRAKEDYLMGINFSRVLTLKYGNSVKAFLKRDKGVIAVGRVMTCVLGIVVQREREIRSFVKTPFYRVLGHFTLGGCGFDAEWRAAEGSRYFQSPKLYKENGFRERTDAEGLIAELCAALGIPGGGERTGSSAGGKIAEGEVLPIGTGARLSGNGGVHCRIEELSRKKESKNPPLLYNLAELQNDCSKRFKISPDQTLAIAQELYEKKLTTYPRTDARVLSSAVAKEIGKNLAGLRGYGICGAYAAEILQGEAYKKIAKSRYVNDKAITDHYAIIPTGQGLGNLGSLNATSARVYELIVRRFLSIFYPPAVYQKIALTVRIGGTGGQPESAAADGAAEAAERFFANFRALAEEGYRKVAAPPAKAAKGKDRDGKAEDAGADPSAGRAESSGGAGARAGDAANGADAEDSEKSPDSEGAESDASAELLAALSKAKKGDAVAASGFEVKEGETSPPKRYTSGSIILTMENAGQFIEDDELRSQIKGSGIGTSATRAEILSKLQRNEYLKLNKKTQVLTPTLLGEMIYDVVYGSITALLNPALTASWEKGLTQVADGSITSGEYMAKLNDFVARRTQLVKGLNNQGQLDRAFRYASQYYRGGKSSP